VASAPDMCCWHCMLFQLDMTGPRHNQLNLAERIHHPMSIYSRDCRKGYSRNRRRSSWWLVGLHWITVLYRLAN